MMQQIEATLDKARVSLQEFGRSWANYSIALGRNALETGAGRLKATASFLEDLSVRLTQAEIRAASEAEATDGATPDQATPPTTTEEN